MQSAAIGPLEFQRKSAEDGSRGLAVMTPTGPHARAALSQPAAFISHKTILFSRIDPHQLMSSAIGMQSGARPKEGNRGRHERSSGSRFSERLRSPAGRNASSCLGERQNLLDLFEAGIASTDRAPSLVSIKTSGRFVLG